MYSQINSEFDADLNTVLGSTKPSVAGQTHYPILVH